MLCREGTHPAGCCTAQKQQREGLSEEDFRGLGQGIDQTEPDGSVTVYATPRPPLCQLKRNRQACQTDSGGMTDHPEYTLSLPPSCPRNQDHLNFQVTTFKGGGSIPTNSS